MNKFKFTKENLIKILKGIGIAMGGAGLVYLGQFLTGTDFGQLTPVAVALGGILINAGREFLKK